MHWSSASLCAQLCQIGTQRGKRTSPVLMQRFNIHIARAFAPTCCAGIAAFMYILKDNLVMLLSSRQSSQVPQEEIQRPRKLTRVCLELWIFRSHGQRIRYIFQDSISICVAPSLKPYGVWEVCLAIAQQSLPLSWV